nr:hypothetical protein CFP56_56584 [Quercus suber]
MGVRMKRQNAVLQQASVLFYAGWYARVLGSLADAESMCKRCNAIHDQELGEEHPDTLSSMANLASTYRNQGRRKKRRFR